MRAWIDVCERMDLRGRAVLDLSVEPCICSSDLSCIAYVGPVSRCLTNGRELIIHARAHVETQERNKVAVGFDGGDVVLKLAERSTGSSCGT